MGKLLPRALGFALLALLVIAIVSAVTLVALVGVPDPRAGTAGFMAQAVAVAPTIDLVVGALVMLGIGWSVARPFVGREALAAAALMAVCYVAIDLATVVLLGRIGNLVLTSALLAWAVKIVAALVGGWLAGRKAAAAE
jgi:hypothetical protein